MAYSEEQILNALAHVEEPDLKKDLVALKMIENVVIEENKVSFTIILTTPACPLKNLIERSCREAIATYVNAELAVDIHMTSKVIPAANKGQMLPNIKNIILVASGKGGVGKSTVSVNLALALSRTGAATGLIDADIYGPSIPIMFKLEGAKPKSVEINGANRILPIEKYGIKMLSIGFFTHPGQPIPWRGPMISTAVKQLFSDAEWGNLDYLVVDLPPGTGDIQITISQTYPISGAVIVTTPQRVALTDAAKGLAMFKMDKIHIPILGVVENMSYFIPPELPEKKYYIFGKNGGIKLAQQFEVPFLEEIPITPAITESGDNGEPIFLSDNPVTQAFMRLSEKVAQQISIHNAAVPILSGNFVP